MTHLREKPHSGSVALLIHLLFWGALFAGLWWHWRPVMMLGFFVTMVNVFGFGAPFGLTLLLSLIALPFAPRTDEGLHIRMALTGALILQVWQFFFWIAGAAAH